MSAVQRTESILSGGGLDTPASPVSDQEARDVALACYGLTGEFRRFAAEKDDTYRIRTGDGTAYVLKIANPAEQAIEVDFQIALLRHLERHDATLPVPRVVPGRAGQWRSVCRVADGTQRLVRLMTFIEGTPLDATRSSPVQREEIGAVLARLRLALADFSHPGEARELAWDVQHLARLAPLLDEITDAGQRRLLAAGLDRFMATTAGLATLRRQVLHNDFSRSNIVVSHKAPTFVQGIIDFGDAVRTAIAVDVATALLNQLPREADVDPLAAGCDLLRGYLSATELTDDEIAMLPHLTLGRVIARALISIWRAQFFPDNAVYILRNTAQSWWQLEWFLSRRADELEHRMLSAVSGQRKG